MCILDQSLCVVETVLLILEGVLEAAYVSVTISSQNENGKRNRVPHSLEFGGLIKCDSLVISIYTK